LRVFLSFKPFETYYSAAAAAMPSSTPVSVFTDANTWTEEATYS